LIYSPFGFNLSQTFAIKLSIQCMSSFILWSQTSDDAGCSCKYFYYSSTVTFRNVDLKMSAALLLIQLSRLGLESFFLF
jgi:hypothetical protein